MDTLDMHVSLLTGSKKHHPLSPLMATPADLFGEGHGFTECAYGCWTRHVDIVATTNAGGGGHFSALQVFYVCEGDGRDYEMFEVDAAGTTTHWLLTNGPRDRRDVWYEDGKLKTLSFTGKTFGGEVELQAPTITLCPQCSIPVVNFDTSKHCCVCV